MSAPWRREADGAIVLSLHVQPGARQSAFAGHHGDALKIRLAAPALEGRANAELMRFIAEAFDVPQRDIRLLRGETSRAKMLRIAAPRRMPSWLTSLPHGGFNE